MVQRLSVIQIPLARVLTSQKLTLPSFPSKLAALQLRKWSVTHSKIAHFTPLPEFTTTKYSFKSFHPLKMSMYQNAMVISSSSKYFPRVRRQMWRGIEYQYRVVDYEIRAMWICQSLRHPYTDGTYHPSRCQSAWSDRRNGDVPRKWATDVAAATLAQSLVQHWCLWLQCHLSSADVWYSRVLNFAATILP